mgnify:CR=1 FL=1
MTQFSIIFLLILCADSGLKLWLNLRQKHAIHKSFNQVPVPFDQHITLEEHQKAVAEKARVAAIVKKMNQDNKKKQKAHPSKESNKTKRKPVRFPGT